MSDSSVKVGIRIRPLIPSEVNQQHSLNNYDNTCINFRNQTYTFDHVFGPDLNQQKLYEDTAAPMLKSFLEGYNVIRESSIHLILSSINFLSIRLQL